MTIGDLASALQAPLEAVLHGLYASVRVDPGEASMTRLVPGCTASDLDAAETRVGYALPPLHRYVLTLSNGGSLPYVNSLAYLAAAVAREDTWRVLGPAPEDVLDEDEPAYRPAEPLTMGTPLDRLLAEVGIDQSLFPAPGLRSDDLIVIGVGYFDADGFYCYSREDPGPVFAAGSTSTVSTSLRATSTASSASRGSFPAASRPHSWLGSVMHCPRRSERLLRSPDPGMVVSMRRGDPYDGPPSLADGRSRLGAGGAKPAQQA